MVSSPFLGFLGTRKAISKEQNAIAAARKNTALLFLIHMYPKIAGKKTADI